MSEKTNHIKARESFLMINMKKNFSFRSDVKTAYIFEGKLYFFEFFSLYDIYPKLNSIFIKILKKG